ncbi:MAG: AzlD domain-containing protein [Erysipelotrichaceae bacterium]
MNKTYLLYILVMAIVTYLIRMLPLAIFRNKIKNSFIKSFLFYVPYAVLAAMTFPAIFSSTNSSISAIFGLVSALYLSYKDKSLIVVALCSCLVVYIIEFIMNGGILC